MAVTNAWNEPFGGAHPMRPFQTGSVNSIMEVGRSVAGSMADVLYTTVRARPDVPTHSPARDRNLASTCSSRPSGSFLSAPPPASAPSDPGSWRNTTSAGVLSPSSSTVAATAALLAYLTRTSTPVSSENDSSSGCTRLWVRPEYTVSVSASSPQAGRTNAETARRAAARSNPVLLRIMAFLIVAETATSPGRPTGCRASR